MLFLNITFSIFSDFSSLNSISLFRTYFVKAGSFSSFHLKGVGVKYGESVSIKMFFNGMFFAVSCISKAFLNVTIQEKLIIESGANLSNC